uniref:ZP domain-containing protein n=1 Tax=Electrophorus electricus TaxID=8005 RepID=A0A4W4GKS9_ELEEL
IYCLLLLLQSLTINTFLQIYILQIYTFCLFMAVALTSPSYDPCDNYVSLDQPWRANNATGYGQSGYFSSHDDTTTEWDGWYWLYLQGADAQISEWCVGSITSGGYTPLMIGGSHPLVEDGIVTREIFGSFTYNYWWYGGYYTSNPIQVKACPGHYYVYKLVKRDVSIPLPVYTTVALTNPLYDPCNNYVSLDQPWRANNAPGLGICDSNFKWNGWYRLLYNGMNICMVESCVDVYRCGTFYPLWLNGPHPQIEDGVVARQVCANAGSDCCFFQSTPINVKACPGNYYVYEFVSPMFCNMAYCTDILIDIYYHAYSSTASPQDDFSFDPCNYYDVVDDYWRNTIEIYNFYTGHDDTIVEWDGWYRLFLQGNSAQLSEWCVNYMTCGGYTPLVLGGSHPRLEDGIVSREIYAYSDGQCNSVSRSHPIQVKACPGNYYVYKLVKPDVSIPMPTYCAVNFTYPSTDPCYNYNELDDSWRATDNADHNWWWWWWTWCDRYTNWNGWYRLFYQGNNVEMPDSCVSPGMCGTDIPLWLNGSLPQLEDGVVVRQVCGSWNSDCCYYKSFPIQVKACPGNYYVYELMTPAFCNSAFCTDIDTISPTSTMTLLSLVNPCENYNVLSDAWRATNNTNHYNFTFPWGQSAWSDTFINWNGWYRLFHLGENAEMPDSCVAKGMCGTFIPLWLNGSYPQLEDGVVTRQVCGSWNSDCCYYKSSPIQVKACPGGYYVYQFVPPTICFSAYCTATVDPCEELNCTEDELCWEIHGVYGCFCNQKESTLHPESYDAIEVCEGSSGSISLSLCQLFESGFSGNSLHLNDPSCRGTVQNGRLVFYFDNDDHICGTNLMANGTHIIYKNSIKSTGNSTEGPINRKKTLVQQFSCIYELTQTLTMATALNPLQSIVHKTLPGSVGMYQVRMIPYQDPGFSHPYNGSADIEVNQRIYVAVIVQGVDSRQIATVIDSCWATPENERNFADPWHLIINKCPNPKDNTVQVLQNGVFTTARFSFKMFTFNKYPFNKVFLHCSIHLCLLQNNNCAMVSSDHCPHHRGTVLNRELQQCSVNTMLVIKNYKVGSNPGDDTNSLLDEQRPTNGGSMCRTVRSWNR